jgi:hypothetical protein
MPFAKSRATACEPDKKNYDTALAQVNGPACFGGHLAKIGDGFAW